MACEIRIEAETGQGEDSVGVAIKGSGAVTGRLVHGAEGVTLRLRVPPTDPVAATRWRLDQVIRNMRGLYQPAPGDVRVSVVGDGLPEALSAALRLDLARAFGPAILEDSPDLGAIAAGEARYRELVNGDPGEVTSLSLAAGVQAFADAYSGPGRVTAEVLAEEDLAREGLDLLRAVGQGSQSSPPRLILATWRPAEAPETARPWLLLGKGVTFDSGGINIKPYESFVSHMRNDMAGAALAITLFEGLVDAGCPVPLALAVPACENAVGETAMRPGTVVKSRNGLSVKIDHTDAEGRLILADGLVLAEERFNPERTFCFATLTTAALVAYGPFATPIHFADAEVARAFEATSERVGDDVHILPARPWHLEANRDLEADLRNTARLDCAIPGAAGSRNAAHFLAHFAVAPLTHLDIFASAWNWARTYPGAGFGCTGAPWRLVYETLRSLTAR